MLSVLPDLAEAQPWAQVQKKRLREPWSLHHSASLRAKRLRQELLRLREWEQRAHQQKTGATEGQGDSWDPSFAVEAHQPQLDNFLCPGFAAEDAWDSTDPLVHGFLPRVDARPPQPEQIPKLRVDPTVTKTQPATNPSDLTTNPVASVQKPRGFGLSCQLACSSALVTTGMCSDTLAGLQGCEEAKVAGPRSPDSWSSQSLELPISGSTNPLRGLAPASCRDESSVKQRSLNCAWGEQNSPGEFVDVEGGSCEIRPSLRCGEENLPGEETSGCGDDEVSSLHSSGTEAEIEGSEENSGSEAERAGEEGEEAEEREDEEGGPVEQEQNTDQMPRKPCLCDSKLSSLAPSSLPHQFLGMPMPQRLRCLQFLYQGAELLGLSLRSVYLATVMLDCCWVEARVSGGEGAASGHRKDLQVSALGCLLHAYLSSASAAASCRSLRAFRVTLHSGSERFPMVASMLPIRPAVLEQCLHFLKASLPFAVAKGSLSASPDIYGSMLKLRGVCTEAQHLASFVSQLWAAGCSSIPADVLGAATCYLVSEATPEAAGKACSGSRRKDGNMVECDHAQAVTLYQFLCAEERCCALARQASCEASPSHELKHTAAEGSWSEASAEVSV